MVPQVHFRTKRIRDWTPIIPTPVASRTRTRTRNKTSLLTLICVNVHVICIPWPAVRLIGLMRPAVNEV